jgi:hypothetical protein
MGGRPLAGAFISYRLAAESHVTARITQQLARHFGADRFFRDVDTMTPGPFYTRAILRALVDSVVLVAVLGPDWSTLAGADGGPRLEDPHDWVRLEVGWAARLNIPIVLVLLDDAEAPTPEQLPAEVAPLAKARPIRVRHDHLRTDLAQLTGALATYLPRPARRHSAPRLPATTAQAAARWVAALLGIVLGVVGAVSLQVRNEPRPPAPVVSGAVAAPASQARITNLSERGSVQRCTTVRGIAPVPATGRAYLLLARSSDNRIHVLGPPLLVHRPGTWEMREVTVGGAAAAARELSYTIMLVSTTASGAAQAERSYRTAAGNLSVTALPSGWRSLYEIHVTRAESMACSGAAYPV